MMNEMPPNADGMAAAFGMVGQRRRTELQPVCGEHAGPLPVIEWLRTWWDTYQNDVRATEAQGLLTAYATTDDEGREFILAVAKRQAAQFPAARPTLRLVSTSMSTADIRNDKADG